MADNALGEIVQKTFQAGETFFLKVSRRESRNGEDRIWFHFKYRIIGLSVEDARKLMATLSEINEPIPARMIEEALATPQPAKDRGLRRTAN